MKRIVVIAFAVILSSLGCMMSPSCHAEVLIQKNEALPVTVFNVTFRAGSAHDPSGKHGLAYVTGRLLREGGVDALGDLPARRRAEIEEFLFPFAADIGVQVGKEQTSFRVSTTAENAEVVFGILSQMLLAPALDGDELARIKSEASLALKKRWPREDPEELGKAALDLVMYGPEHPYAHVVTGKVSGVEGLTRENVRAFLKSRYTRSNLTLGISGVVPAALQDRARALADALPAGGEGNVTIAPARKIEGRQLTIVEGDFKGTGVHLGHGISVLRGDDDFPALYLGNTAYGKHRTFVGRLQNIVRSIRGMNYGTYSYIEDFPNGGALLLEPTQASRSHQAFTVWGRPTTPENGCFLLRLLVRETEKLASEGITAEEFGKIRGFLVGNIPLLATSLSGRLGYEIDSRFYDVSGDFLGNLQASVKALTHEKVNAALERHLQPAGLHIVVVTKDAKKFIDEITADRCDITYGPGATPRDPAILAADKEIAVYDIGVERDAIRVLPAERIFN